MNEITESYEEGVCVACKCSTRAMFRFPTGWKVPCCDECTDDGSLSKWLEKELEDHAMANNWPYRVVNGRKLFTDPEAASPKTEKD